MKKDEIKEQEKDPIIENINSAFEAMIPMLVEHGVSQSFIDENRDACREMYRKSYLFYFTMPVAYNAKKLFMDLEKLDKVFGNFVDVFIKPEMGRYFEDETSTKYMTMIFLFAFTMAHQVDSDGKLRFQMFIEARKKRPNSFCDEKIWDV